jgi:hypothetical protein
MLLSGNRIEVLDRSGACSGVELVRRGGTGRARPDRYVDCLTDSLFRFYSLTYLRRFYGGVAVFAPW